MRTLLAEIAPVPGDPAANLDRIEACLAGGAACDLALFPELFLSGYRVGDRLHALALRPEGAAVDRLREAARRHGCTLVLGAPVVHPGRSGETQNAAVLVRPDGSLSVQAKRFLPTFGPFEEGRYFTAEARSTPLAVAGHPVGFAICYDTFFPEIFRELAQQGSELFAILSASPITSRRLFERLLPARAIENGASVLYVNRVGVEDGVVFGGGSGGWDPRGEPIRFDSRPAPGGAPEERLLTGTVEPERTRLWRPFRPVLRDLTARPAAPA